MFIHPCLDVRFTPLLTLSISKKLSLPIYNILMLYLQLVLVRQQTFIYWMSVSFVVSLSPSLKSRSLVMGSNFRLDFKMANVQNDLEAGK